MRLLAAVGRSFPAFSPRSLRSASRALGLLAFAGMWTVAGAGQADIYKSVDSSGVISFTNHPQSGGRLIVKETKEKRAGVQPFMPADTSPERYTRFDEHIHQAAALYQIPEALVRAVIKVESDFDPRALSRANAHGLMQLMPDTATRMMVSDIYDPRQNVFGGVRYLRVLANLFNGDIELTVAGYNAGENAVIRYGGIPPYEETQAYVGKVLSFYRYYRAARLGQ